MDRDARRMRGDRPFVFCALRHGTGADAVVRHIIAAGGLSVPGFGLAQTV